jgi:GT2 family glycosyltransferase
MRALSFADQEWGKAFAFIPLTPGGWTLEGGDPLARVPDAPDAFAVFAQADALAMPGFERAVLLAADAYPGAQLLYGSDAALGERGPERLRLKPAFNQTLLYADDYIGAPLVVRGSALHALGGLRPEMGEAALYDLTLRAAALGMGVEALRQTLLAYPGARPKVAAGDRRRALDARLANELFEVAPGRTEASFALRRLFDAHPEVTVVVPTRQSGPADGSGPPYVVELLDSLAGLDWPMDRLAVLVGDDSEAQATFADGRWPFRVRRIATPRPPGEPFSYAAKMNRLWRAAETEQLVLVNDDVTVRGPGWLKALLTFSMQADVGGCGGRLLFPDGRLQHAGMAGGLFGGVTHLWAGQPGDRPTYQDWALVHREWSAVTGAVFATRRSAMEAADGFDERFSLEYNDVDLCFRLRLMGYRIVCTPFAEGVHREMASRGYAPPDPEQTALFLSRWRELLADDPAYHPRLTRETGAATPTDEPDWFDR